MPSGYPEPLILEKDGVKTFFPSIRNAWLTALRGPHDSPNKIGQANRERVRSAILTHTRINGYYIYYASNSKRFMEKGDTLPLEEGMLPLVSSVAEIQRNAETLGAYLQNTNSPEREYTKERIRMGKCFVIVSSPNGYCFYPSRFMGYVDNSMEAHEKMGELKKKIGKPAKDGRKTNPKITAVLGEELIKKENEQWGRWETEYRNFCKRLGIVPNNNDRKYWPPIR